MDFFGNLIQAGHVSANEFVNWLHAIFAALDNRYLKCVVLGSDFENIQFSANNLGQRAVDNKSFEAWGMRKCCRNAFRVSQRRSALPAPM